MAGEKVRTSVVALASAKGGAGKTFLSATLARLLAGLDKKVLLVDVDATTNGLTLFYLEQTLEARKQVRSRDEETYGIFELKGPPSPFELDERVSFLPAAYVMSQTESIPDIALRERMGFLLQEAQGRYDYVILDAQAGSHPFSQVAMEYADKVVIVSEFDPISAEGVERLRRLYGSLVPAQKTWVLFNKVLPEFARSLGNFSGMLRYLSPVPWDADVVRAFARKKLALDLEKGNPHTVAVMETAALLFEEIEDEIRRWRDSLSEALRRPAEEQIDQLATEIAALEEMHDLAETHVAQEADRPRVLLWAIALGFGFFALGIVWFVAFDADVSSREALALAGLPLALLTLVASAVLISVRFVMTRSVRLRKVRLAHEMRALRRRIAELQQRRDKLQVVVGSELPHLVEKAR